MPSMHKLLDLTKVVVMPTKHRDWQATSPSQGQAPLAAPTCQLYRIFFKTEAYENWIILIFLVFNTWRISLFPHAPPKFKDRHPKQKEFQNVLRRNWYKKVCNVFSHIIAVYSTVNLRIYPLFWPRTSQSYVYLYRRCKHKITGKSKINILSEFNRI